jgi:hypothetical protein
MLENYAREIENSEVADAEHSFMRNIDSDLPVGDSGEMKGM